MTLTRAASHSDLFKQELKRSVSVAGGAGREGWWSSGLVRTNMSTYGQMMQCDVSLGHVDGTCRVMTWIHTPWRQQALYCLSWISPVCIVMLIETALAYACCCQHLTWFKLTGNFKRFHFQIFARGEWNRGNEQPLITYSKKGIVPFLIKFQLIFLLNGRIVTFQI